MNRLVVLCCSMLMFFASGCSPSSANRKAERPRFIQFLIDVGYVASSGKRIVSLELINPTTEPLQITNVRQSCRCGKVAFPNAVAASSSARGTVTIHGDENPLERTIAIIMELSLGETCLCKIRYWTGQIPAAVPKSCKFDHQVHGWPVQVFVNGERGKSTAIDSTVDCNYQVLPSADNSYAVNENNNLLLKRSGLISLGLLVDGGAELDGSNISFEIHDGISNRRVTARLVPRDDRRVVVLPSSVVASNVSCDVLFRSTHPGVAVLSELTNYAEFEVQNLEPRVVRIRINRWKAPLGGFPETLEIPIAWETPQGSRVTTKLRVIASGLKDR